jgi:hypothetical protein
MTTAAAGYDDARNSNLDLIRSAADVHAAPITALNAQGPTTVTALRSAHAH